MEFLECPPRNFDDDVINRRFKTGGCFGGNVVWNFVKCITDSEFRGDFGDREPGGFRGERGAARDARVHLNYHLFSRARIHSELDIRAARVHPDFSDNFNGGIPHLLIFPVRQRLDGRDGNAITGVNPHRVNVFNGADDYDVVCTVSHHLQFKFLPADDRFFDEEFIDWAERDAGGYHLLIFFDVIGDAAAGAAEGEGGPDNRREADVLHEC